MHVSYPEGPGGKTRPVAIVPTRDGRLMVFNVSTKYKTKSKVIKRQYAEIKDWRAAGLDKPSWIDVRAVRLVTQETFNTYTPSWVGRLTARDVMTWLTKAKAMNK